MRSRLWVLTLALLISMFAQEPRASLAVAVIGSPTSAQLAASPSDTVARYYALIGVGHFPDAWEMLSPGRRTAMNEDYQAWVGGHANTRSVQTPSVVTVAEFGEAASVAMTIVAVDAEPVGLVTRTFQGTRDLVWLGDAWRLDTPSIYAVAEQVGTVAAMPPQPVQSQVPPAPPAPQPIAAPPPPPPAPPAPPAPAPAPAPPAAARCDASYPDFCIPPPPPDLDCTSLELGGRKRFTVRPPDPHRFDADKDGIGCER